MARRLEVGTANVNDVLVGFLASDVPMGGWKDSGIGCRHGEYGIKKFVRPESLVITRFGAEAGGALLPLHGEAPQPAPQDRDVLQRARAEAAPRPLSPAFAADQLAVEPLGLTVEPLGDHPQPGDLGAGPDPDVVRVILAGEPQRVGDGQVVTGIAVVPDQGPVGAPAGTVLLQRQPRAVAQQQGLRLATPYLDSLHSFLSIGPSFVVFVERRVCEQSLMKR